MARTSLLGFSASDLGEDGVSAKAAFVGFIPTTVTNTSDSGTGSLRAAIGTAQQVNGGAVNFALPANSTITLASALSPTSLTGVSGLINFDFTGASGLTVTSTGGPFTVLRDYRGMALTGTLNGDANSGVLLQLLSPTATATLNTSAVLASAATASATIDDGGQSLTVGANATVIATSANALSVNQNNGAVTGQTVSVLGGATVTASGAAAAVTLTGAATFSNAGSITQTFTSAVVTNTSNAVYNAGTGAFTNTGTISSVGNSSGPTSGGFWSAAYVAANASTLTNSGTISSAGGNAYSTLVYAPAAGFVNTSNLINTSTGVITNTYAISTVNLAGAATLNNAGLISNQGGGTALVNQGSGAATNSGTIRSITSTAYSGSSSSLLTNISTGQVTSGGSGNVVTLGAGSAGLSNAGTVSNTGTGAAVSNSGTGTVTNSGTFSSATNYAYTSSAANALTNSGTLTSASTAGAARLLTDGGSITNSGMISNTGGTGRALDLYSGATLNSTGTIQASASTNYAVALFGTTGTTTVNLAAGSTTTGIVGSNVTAQLALTLGGTLTGNIFGGTGADAVKLLNGSSFTGQINLNSGADVLTLDGASGSTTLAGSSIGSNLALVKAGAGTWALSGTTTRYTSIALNGGVLELAAANAVGSSAITFGTGSQTLRLNVTGSSFALGSTLSGFGVEDVLDVRGTTVTGSSVSGDTLTLTTGLGTAVVNFASGTLSGKAISTGTDNAGGSFVSIGAALATSSVGPGTTVNVNSTGAPVLNGDIADSGTAAFSGASAVTYTGGISGGGGISVAGAGAVTLTGTSTYSGTTSVGSGTLVVNGSIANSPVTVGSGGTLGGGGTTGTVNVSTGGTLSPGNSPGVLNTLDLTLAGALKEEIGGLGAGQFDQMKVTGTVNLTGATLNASLFGGYVLPAAGAAPIVIIDNDGVDAVTGTFAGLAEGATFTLGGQSVRISYVGGTGNDVTLQILAAPVAPPTTTVTTTSPTPSQAVALPTQTSNLLRLDPASADAMNTAGPLYQQAQAAASIQAQYDQGKIFVQDAQLAIFHLVDGTTSLAEISYAFFTGKTPTSDGLNYLVHSANNPSDLNDPYYQSFNNDNRYINFAVNLGTGGGAGAAAFNAAYGSLSLTDAATKAYQAVFGIAPAAGKIAAILNELVPNGLGGTETRAQYLADITGGTAIAQKAAVVGYFLADSLREGGVYANADQHFLADLAHGTASFNVDLVATYGPTPTLVGATVADPTVPH